MTSMARSIASPTTAQASADNEVYWREGRKQKPNPGCTCQSESFLLECNMKLQYCSVHLAIFPRLLLGAKLMFLALRSTDRGNTKSAGEARRVLPMVVNGGR